MLDRYEIQTRNYSLSILDLLLPNFQPLILRSFPNKIICASLVCDEIDTYCSLLLEYYLHSDSKRVIQEIICSFKSAQISSQRKKTISKLSKLNNYSNYLCQTEFLLSLWRLPLFDSNDPFKLSKQILCYPVPPNIIDSMKVVLGSFPNSPSHVEMLKLILKKEEKK